jgi:hypothetical protein
MWKKILGVPGCCSFWEYRDGRLAITHGGRHPGLEPDWVDVNRPAKLDNTRHELLVPILSSVTGQPSFRKVTWPFVPGVLRMTGLQLTPANTGSWDEPIIIEKLEEHLEGRAERKWVYRSEGRGGETKNIILEMDQQN